eukprot:7066-Heterococcus_DN1.PRE.1
MQLQEGGACHRGQSSGAPSPRVCAPGLPLAYERPGHGAISDQSKYVGSSMNSSSPTAATVAASADGSAGRAVLADTGCLRATLAQCTVPGESSSMNH